MQMNTKVNIAGVEFKNPVMTASGTFGSGMEYEDFVDLNRLGAVVTKGVANVPWPGNPTPRVTEVYGGMLNAIGLQNPGIDVLIEQKVPALRRIYNGAIIANISGFSIEEYAYNCAQAAKCPGIDIIEVNVSCPNVHNGGMAFGTQPASAGAVTKAVREAVGDCGKPVFIKLSPNVTDIAAIAKAGGCGVPTIKPWDRDTVFAKLDAAKAANPIAIAMDIDAAGLPFLKTMDANGPTAADNMNSKSVEEMRELIEYANMPFIIKGIMSPSQAEKCLEIGVAGIVVSHHHGMINYSCPPLMVLPEIRKVVGDKYPVFVDCGFESGMDVYKALALGATAVSVGRHLMPLLKDGAGAVSSRIDAMTAELAGIMARTGVRDLKHFDPTVIHKRNF